jgi:hypothetical protein
VHPNRRRGERVVRREHEGSPILSSMIRRILRTRYNVMPSNPVTLAIRLLSFVNIYKKNTYSRMLDSDGWAMM